MKITSEHQLKAIHDLSELKRMEIILRRKFERKLIPVEEYQTELHSIQNRQNNLLKLLEVASFQKQEIFQSNKTKK